MCFIFLTIMNNNKSLLLIVFLTVSYNLFAQQSSKSIFAWGDSKNAPRQLGSDSTWFSISTLGRRTFAIKNDGTLWGWGENESGQLGLGNNNIYSTPQQIGTDSNWAQVSAGWTHALALKKNGTLWCWGMNEFGQLGLGNNNSYNTPQRIGSDSNWSLVSANFWYSICLKKNGTLWSWGKNEAGQLGIGNNDSNYNYPKLIGKDSNWGSVSTGLSVVLAIKRNGTLWSWGGNKPAGLGAVPEYNIPQQIGSDSNWLNVAVGGGHHIAIKKNGTLWSWGNNNYGQLGLGNYNKYNYPQQIDYDTNWLFASAGWVSTFGIKKDGTLWSWGYNKNGELGLGNDSVGYNLPQKVGLGNKWISVSAGSVNTVALRSPCKMSINSSSFLGSDKKLICDSDSVVLYSNIAFVKYMWQNGSGDSIQKAKHSGFYNLIGTDAEGCQFFDTIGVYFVNSKINKIKDTFCYLDTPRLVVVEKNKNEFTPKYFWNNSNISSSDYLVFGEGNVKVKLLTETPYGYCYDSTFLVILNAPEILTNPEDIGVKHGDARFFINTKKIVKSYQWQIDQGIGWINLTNASQFMGVNADTLIVSNVTIANNNQRFRCVVFGECGEDTSSSATLNVWGLNTDGFKNLAIKISPNPVLYEINIEEQKYSGSYYQIFSLSGKLIQFGKYTSVIPVPDLPSGIYILKLQNVTLKFIKN